MSIFSCCKRCLITLLVIAIFVVLIHGWITYKSYVFNHKAVSTIAVKYAASKGRKVVKAVLQKLYQTSHSLK